MGPSDAYPASPVHTKVGFTPVSASVYLSLSGPIPPRPAQNVSPAKTGGLRPFDKGPDQDIAFLTQFLTHFHICCVRPQLKSYT